MVYSTTFTTKNISHSCRLNIQTRPMDPSLAISSHENLGQVKPNEPFALVASHPFVAKNPTSWVLFLCDRIFFKA